MLITKNGSIEGLPYTSMKKENGVWLHLLVCQVPLDKTDEELTALFNTDTVEDDAIGVRWDYTQFVKVAADDKHKYVWLTYTAQTAAAEQYAEALNILGVQTEESEVESDVSV